MKMLTLGELLVAGALLTGCGGSGNKSNNQLNHQDVDKATSCSLQQAMELLSENNATLEVKCKDPDGLGKKGTIIVDGQVIEFTIPEGSTAYDSNFTINNLLEGTTIATLEVLAKDGETGEEELHTFTTEVKTIATPTPENPTPTPEPVLDTIAPTLSSTNKSFTTTVGTPLTLETVTATDNVDGNVVVTQTGTVDFNTIGTYIVTYSAKDKAGNESVITHTYIVEEAPNTPPSFSNIPDKFSEDGGGRDFSEDFSGYIQNPNGGTFSATGLPDDMTINPTTGVVTGFFDADPQRSNRDGNSNVYNVIIKYTKNGTTYNSNTFVWKIKDNG